MKNKINNCISDIIINRGNGTDYYMEGEGYGVGFQYEYRNGLGDGNGTGDSCSRIVLEDIEDLNLWKRNE